MKVSLLLSIHNRSKLLAMGLESLVRQSDFTPHEWEVLILDDQSTEDLSLAYGPFVGRLNIRHIRIDHRRHPIYQELNPNGPPTDGSPPKWWHTPALSINIGICKARGEVLWISQPEVLQGPNNLIRGWEATRHGGCFAMADIWNDKHEDSREPKCVRDSILERGQWPPPHNWNTVDQLIEEYRSRLCQERPAMFWYSAFCEKAAAVWIEGVREVYLRGAAAEDDDFRDRLALAGHPPHLLAGCQGLHLYHGDEREFHHRRDHEHWEQGLRQNRGFYFAWRDHPGRRAKASEQEGVWQRLNCIEWEKEASRV